MTRHNTTPRPYKHALSPPPPPPPPRPQPKPPPQKSLNSSGRVGLDFYRAYDAGRATVPPARFFDSWRRALEMLPDALVVRCRDMAAPGLFQRPTDMLAPPHTALLTPEKSFSRHPLLPSPRKHGG